MPNTDFDQMFADANVYTEREYARVTDDTYVLRWNYIAAKREDWDYLPAYRLPNTGHAQLHPSAIEESNARYMETNYADGQGVWWFETNHLYAQSIYIVPSLMPDEETAQEMLDILSGLEDYPVIDESLWSDVEQDWITQSVADYMRYDYAATNDRDDAYDMEDMYAAFEATDVWPMLEDDYAYCDRDDLVKEWLKINR